MHITQNVWSTTVQSQIGFGPETEERTFTADVWMPATDDQWLEAEKDTWEVCAGSFSKLGLAKAYLTRQVRLTNGHGWGDSRKFRIIMGPRGGRFYIRVEN